MIFDVQDNADEAVVQALVAGVRAHNFAHAGPETSNPLSVVCRDAAGLLLGGVAGRTIYKQWLVDVLWVADGARGTGLGRELMRQAETVARARGCLAAQVDTLSFQAPAFYEKLGFEVVGRVTGVPGSPDRFFLLKRLDEDGAAGR